MLGMLKKTPIIIDFFVQLYVETRIQFDLIAYYKAVGNDLNTYCVCV